MVSGSLWPQRSPGGSHPGPRWAILTWATERMLLFWGLSSTMLYPQPLWSGGCGPEGKESTGVSRCASKRAPSPGPPGGWLTDCTAITYCDWLHSRRLPLTCRHNLFCRLSLAKCYLLDFPVPLRNANGHLFSPIYQVMNTQKSKQVLNITGKINLLQIML